MHSINSETRYRPQNKNIVGEGLSRLYYSNRYLYEGNTGAYIMAGDRPHLRFCRKRFMFGTLRLFLHGRPLDEFRDVRMEYGPCTVRWTIRDGEQSLDLTVTTPGDGLGFVLRAEPETEITFLYRGIHGKPAMPGWDAVEGWNFSIFSADQDLLTTEFDPAWLVGNMSGKEGNVCYLENLAVGAKFGGQGRAYLVTDGACDEADGVISGSFRRYIAAAPTIPEDPAALFAAGLARGERLVSRLDVQTPDEYINSIAHAAAIEVDAAWHPPKSVHGNMSWCQPLTGWMMHGQHILGYHDRTMATLKAYQRTQIKDDVKRDYSSDANGLLPTGNSRFYGKGYLAEDQGFYNMQTQFFHQMISAWRYSGDKELGEILRDMLRLHLIREDECFDPEGTGLYESVVNTWPTDSVYTPGGAVEETCYAYHAYKALAELTEGEEQKTCKSKAEKIKKAFMEKLWIPERGYPGAYVEYGGQKRLHPDAWIYSAFLPIECELIDGFDAVQNVDYPRWALKQDENGLYWISNWTPGIWSVRECSSGENMQLVIAGFKAGKPDKSMEVLSGMAKSSLDKLSPGDLSFPVTEPATQTARAIVEGLFGYRPDYPNGRVTFSPSIPASWENASIKTGDFDLHYTREGMTVTLTRPAQLTIRMRLYAEKLVAVEGACDWKLVPAIGGMVLEADMGYTDRAELRLSVEGFRDFDQPEELTELPTDMTDIYDPQNAVATPYGHHMMFRKTPEGWYREIRLDLGENPAEAELVRKQREPIPTDATFATIDLTGSMNADVRQIFKQRYMSPRPERGCHAQIGYDGYSLWTFPFWGILPHEMEIDRHGILQSSAGVPLLIAKGDRNVVFTSLWDNYPDLVEIPVNKEGRMAFVAVSGSTNPNLCGIENARLRFRYADGTDEILPLVNPRNYIQLTPYPERAPTKGYEERRDVFNKYDEDLLKDFTPEVMWLGEKLRTLVIRWPMKANTVLASVTIETTSPDVVAGVMAITVAG